MEFGLISDPGDEGECEELAAASVDLQSLLHNQNQTLLLQCKNTIIKQIL